MFDLVFPRFDYTISVCSFVRILFLFVSRCFSFDLILSLFDGFPSCKCDITSHLWLFILQLTMKWLCVMTYFQSNISQPICQCLLNANFRPIFHLLHKQLMEKKKKNRFGLATLEWWTFKYVYKTQSHQRLKWTYWFLFPGRVKEKKIASSKGPQSAFIWISNFFTTPKRQLKFSTRNQYITFRSNRCFAFVNRNFDAPIA